MRQHGRVAPQFWTKGSGAALRDDDAARLLALYLFTCPSSNMIGLYYLPIPTMAFELGWPEAKLRAALARVEREKIAFYDESESLVWLPEGATYQTGQTLKPTNNVRKTVANMLRPWSAHRFGVAFLKRYREPYALSEFFPGDRSSTSPGPVPKGSRTGPVPVHPDPASASDPDPVIDAREPGRQPDHANPDVVAIASHIATLAPLDGVVCHPVAVAEDIAGHYLALSRPVPLDDVLPAISRLAEKVRCAAQSPTPMEPGKAIELLKRWAKNPQDPGESSGGRSQSTGRPSPSGTPWRAPRNVVPIRAGGDRS